MVGGHRESLRESHLRLPSVPISSSQSLIHLNLIHSGTSFELSVYMADQNLAGAEGGRPTLVIPLFICKVKVLTLLFARE